VVFSVPICSTNGGQNGKIIFFVMLSKLSASVFAIVMKLIMK